jgi:hypothetical protein
MRMGRYSGGFIYAQRKDEAMMSREQWVELEARINAMPRFVVEEKDTLAGKQRAVVCDTEGCGFWRSLYSLTDGDLTDLNAHDKSHDESGQ